MRRIKSLRERFDGKVVPEAITGCWLWTASTAEFGYGQIGAQYPSKVCLLAHRVSWELHRGRIPDGLHVLHRCDTPACVNPDHLFLGTHQDNIADMNSKGRARPCGQRWARGEDHGAAKLTEAGVREIRDANESLNRLALRFGVSKKLVLLVRQRRAWRHVS